MININIKSINKSLAFSPSKFTEDEIALSRANTNRSLCNDWIIPTEVFKSLFSYTADGVVNEDTIALSRVNKFLYSFAEIYIKETMKFFYDEKSYKPFEHDVDNFFKQLNISVIFYFYSLKYIDKIYTEFIKRFECYINFYFEKWIENKSHLILSGDNYTLKLSSTFDITLSCEEKNCQKNASTFILCKIFQKLCSFNNIDLNNYEQKTQFETYDLSNPLHISVIFILTHRLQNKSYYSLNCATVSSEIDTWVENGLFFEKVENGYKFIISKDKEITLFLNGDSESVNSLGLYFEQYLLSPKIITDSSSKDNCILDLYNFFIIHKSEENIKNIINRLTSHIDEDSQLKGKPGFCMAFCILMRLSLLREKDGVQTLENFAMAILNNLDAEEEDKDDAASLIFFLVTTNLLKDVDFNVKDFKCFIMKKFRNFESNPIIQGAGLWIERFQEIEEMQETKLLEKNDFELLKNCLIANLKHSECPVETKCEALDHCYKFIDDGLEIVEDEDIAFLKTYAFEILKDSLNHDVDKSAYLLISLLLDRRLIEIGTEDAVLFKKYVIGKFENKVPQCDLRIVSMPILTWMLAENLITVNNKEAALLKDCLCKYLISDTDSPYKGAAIFLLSMITEKTDEFFH